MVPVVTDTKTVDMSGSSAFNVEFGFVPDFVVFVDATNSIIAAGEVGGGIVEAASTPATVTGGVSAYNGDDYAGLTIDPSQFSNVAASDTKLIGYRTNG